jgi:hypothetical protein
MAHDIPQTFTHILVHDVVSARRVQEHDTPTHRRELVRAVFAAVEGLHWQLKQDVANHRHVIPGGLTAHEQAAMVEETYLVDEQGRVSVVPRFLPLATAIRLVVRIVQRYRTDYKGAFDHVGWSHLKAAIEVRNRIVHPKRLEDLTVSEEEMQKSMSGFCWILALQIEVLRETHAHFKELGWDIEKEPAK